MMARVAVAVRDGVVAPRVEDADTVKIVEVGEGLQLPASSPDELARRLEGMQVHVLLAGGVGWECSMALARHGIVVIANLGGLTPAAAIEAWRGGRTPLCKDGAGSAH